MNSTLKDKKVFLIFIISLFFLFSSIVFCLLIYRDINRSKLYYLKSQEILTLNDDLDYLIQDVVFQSLRYQQLTEKNLLKDKMNTINSKISRLEFLVDNQLPNKFIVGEINKGWHGLMILSDIEKFNILYDLEKLQNSLYVNETDNMNLNLLATSKNINLLAVFSFISLAMSCVLFIFFYYLNRVRDQRNQIELLKVKDSSQRMTTFLSIAGHELRTPLNGIIGLSEILRKSHLPETETYYADHLYHTGKTLLKITNNILELSKNILSPVELEEEDFSLGLLIQQILTIYSFEAQQKKINLTFLLENDVPSRLVGDSSRISQVLFNLVGNAIINTISGTIIFKIKKLGDSNDKLLTLQFSVEDSGIGLTEEELMQLMNPSKQIQFSANNGGDYHGLSFAVCNQLVQAMGGELKIKSQKGVGSTFSFTAKFSQYSNENLDVEKINKGFHFNKLASFSPCFNKNFKPTILVVDDNPASLLIAQIMLERLGAKVLTAVNGKDALNIYPKAKFDLILMDCRMPEMDGYEATKLLRRINVKIPIIAMTASASSEDIIKFSKSGMSGHILKPLEIDSLTEELKKSLCLEPNSFSLDALAKLEESIGYTGMSKTVEAFLNDLPGSEEKLEISLKNNDLEQIHKIGHRYKSSCMAVGAKGLANLFSDLETVENLNNAKDLSEEIHKALPGLKYKLTEHISHPF